MNRSAATKRAATRTCAKFKRIMGSLVLIGLTSVTITACTSLDGYRDATPNPDDRLDDILILLQYASESDNGCLEIKTPPSAIRDCQRLIVEAERIYNDFPYHRRTMMTLAVLYYQIQRNDRAQFMLDQLLATSEPPFEAAILRAEIALKEGNPSLAERVLTEQLVIAPENPVIRSALASVYYLKGETKRSRAILNADNVLYEKPWELAYHNGLLAESDRDWRDACRLYQSALIQNSDYRPARSRLFALSEYITCDAPITTTTALNSKESDGLKSTSTQQEVSPPLPAEKTRSYEPEQTEKPTPPQNAIARSSVLGLSVNRINDNQTQLTVEVDSHVSDAFVFQLNSPPRLLLVLPTTENLLGFQTRQLSDNLLKSLDIYQSNSELNLNITTNDDFNVQMTNQQNTIQLLFDRRSDIKALVRKQLPPE